MGHRDGHFGHVVNFSTRQRSQLSTQQVPFDDNVAPVLLLLTTIKTVKKFFFSYLIIEQNKF